MIVKIGLLAPVILIFGACSLFAPSEPPLPPLLVNVDSRGGWYGACPPQNKREAELMQDLALSPKLNERLTNEFPPGTDESRLIGFLIKQRFQMKPPCDTDQSIHRASFRQNSGIGLFGYLMHADVFWKVDERNAIVWTKGFIVHEGL